MEKDSNGKEQREELVTVIVKVPKLLDASIQGYHESKIAKGELPSRSDILRELLVTGLRGVGFGPGEVR